MKPYQINEGTFSLPDDIGGQDSTLNIFRHSTDNTVLMVARGAIPAGRSFEDELESQWAQLWARVERVQSTPKTRVLLPCSPGVDAWQTDCHFRQGGHIQYQRQLALHLPHKSQMLIFTHTSQIPFTQVQNQYWQRLCETLCLAKRAEAAHG
ncbi:DcrB-related protein [Buttiauxella gaviniae]|uniref:DcrB-related protein n=1 Tax=Buttiauxella gaviniae TaxID=82990 RepID=A0ABV3P0X5_9ENTR